MQLSGQTNAQPAHPIQASGLAILRKLYPFPLTEGDNSITPNGQAVMHTPHPLHRSVFITSVPFTVAIRMFFIPPIAG